MGPRTDFFFENFHPMRALEIPRCLKVSIFFKFSWIKIFFSKTEGCEVSIFGYF